MFTVSTNIEKMYLKEQNAEEDGSGVSFCASALLSFNTVKDHCKCNIYLCILADMWMWQWSFDL